MRWHVRFIASRRRQDRKGVVAVLAALFLGLIFVFAAFGVDSGRITSTQAQMQMAVDAAALAATQEILKESVEGEMANETVDHDAVAAQVRQVAADVATANGVYLNVDTDVELGSQQYNEMTGEKSIAWGVAPYNVVRVTARRDQEDVSKPDGRFPLAFGWAVGKSSVKLTTTATAGFDDSIIGFGSPDQSQTSSLMPFVIEVNAWNDMLAGSGSDEWSFNETSGEVEWAADGFTEINMFPGGGGNNGGSGNGNGGNGNGNGNGNGGNGNGNGNGGNGNGGNQITPGNFGTIDIGNPNNAAPDLWRQIRNGPNASDFSYHGGELKLQDDYGNPLVVNGDTGVTASMQQALADIVGQPRTIMLYESVTGQGNNTYFTIVAFVGIRVLDYDLNGGNKYIRIQPAPVVDDTIINGAIDDSSYYVRGAVTMLE